MNITAVVTTYNSEAFMRTMLDSVLRQTYKDYELIIVDDGSDDNSHEIAKEYEKRYECVLAQRIRHGGPAIARNYGLTCAKGNYVVFLDSDDEIKEDYFERMLNRITSEDADVVCGGFCSYVIKGDKRHFMAQKTLKDEVYLPEYIDVNQKYEMFSAMDGACWNKMYHRSFLEKYEVKFPCYKPGMSGEDAYFNFKVMEHASKIVTFSYIGYWVYKRERDVQLERRKEKWNVNSFQVIINAFEEVEKIFDAAQDTQGKEICKQILDRDVYDLILETLCNRITNHERQKKLEKYYENDWMQDKISRYGTESKSRVICLFYRGEISAVVQQHFFLKMREKAKTLLRPFLYKYRSVMKRARR